MAVDFLKKIGEIAQAGAILVPVFGPLIKNMIPGSKSIIQNVEDEIGKFANAVVQVEVITAGLKANIPGDQKIKAVLPNIAQVVAMSSVVFGKKISDKALYDKAIMGYAQATVDLLKSVDPAEAKEINIQSGQWDQPIVD